MLSFCNSMAKTNAAIVYDSVAMHCGIYFR